MQEVHQATFLGQRSNASLTSQRPLHHQRVPQEHILHGQVPWPSTTIVVIIVDHGYDLWESQRSNLNNSVPIPNLFQGWIRLSTISILVVVAVLVRNGNVALTYGDFTSVVDREHDERGEWWKV
jgi:hypothetical protein